MLFFSISAAAQQPDQPTIKESLEQLNLPDHTTGKPGFELPKTNEELIDLKAYDRIDASLFSLMDFLSLANQQFPNDNPWNHYKEFKFRLADHAKYISLKARPFNSSKVIYNEDKTVKVIYIE
jgi:hypothetical protein